MNASGTSHLLNKEKELKHEKNIKLLSHYIDVVYYNS
jgi:hypothetical protein